MFLLVSVCLLADPGQCREERITISDKSNPAICLRVAQGVLAQWAGDHPEYAIKKWRCAAQDAPPGDLWKPLKHTAEFPSVRSIGYPVCQTRRPDRGHALA